MEGPASTGAGVSRDEPRSRIRDLIVRDGPLMPVILRLSAPVVLMMYLQGAYNIVDTIWVGQLLGRLALAGVATGGFVLWSIFGLTNLVTVGITARIARRIGENDHSKAEEIAAKGIWYAWGLSLVSGGGLWFLTPALFELMGTDPVVTALGTDYLRVILLGCPFFFLSFLIQRIFQAAGDTVTPMWLMFASLLLNAVLDPLLMAGWLGFPKLGVAGAALATVIARFLMVFFGVRLLLRRRRIRARRPRLRLLAGLPPVLPALAPGYLGLPPSLRPGWDWRLFLSTLRTGLPNAVTQTLFPVVYMAITRLPAAHGPEHIAALRIGHTVEGLSFFLALGFSMATATCVGQNLGAGKPERAARSGWIASGAVAVVLSVLSLLFYFFSSQISRVFSTDPGTVAASATYLEILSISQVFMGIEIVLVGAFSGAGDTLPPMAILVPLNVSRIPLAYLLDGPAGLGVSGVWWAMSGTSILKGLLMAFWFHRGRWRRKNV